VRFAVEAWAPEYGSPNEAGAMAETEVPVDLAVERPIADWAPIAPTPGTAEPPVVVFVDGVRRVEARVWVTGDGGEPHPGICASYAAGAVRCDERATVVATEVERGLFCRSSGAAPIATRSGTYGLRATAADDPDTLAIALQGAMAELEARVSAAAVVPGQLLVLDGPLGARRALPGAVGYVKTHHVTYLPAELRAVVARLAAGERTPLFAMGDRFPRHSWYLRLPGEVEHAWAGVVRCEAAADIALPEVLELADRVTRLLPRFASGPHKEPRAPQNLYPIAGLERELRRRLGDPRLLQRSLREAARRSRPDAAEPDSPAALTAVPAPAAVPAAPTASAAARPGP
jgi:hypothetical protein